MEKTKEQWIEEYRAEHSELYKQVDDERIKLNDEEYEETINYWAENQIAMEEEKIAKEESLLAKESAKSKLLALGLSEEEISALVK
jgi:hypothetical protein